MDSPEERLLAELENQLPGIEFEGWYHPNPLNLGPFVIRAIRTDLKSGITRTFDTMISTDSLEPIESLAESLAPRIQRALFQGGVRRFRRSNLTVDQLTTIVKDSLPPDKWKQWFGKSDWVVKDNYSWHEGSAGTANIRLGPLLSVAIKGVTENEEREIVVAGWYYESGIVELDYYPDYSAAGGTLRKVPLDVDSPEHNVEVISRELRSS